MLDPPWPREDLLLRGRTLSVRHAPGPAGAPAAVFVHGLGGSSLNWTDLMSLARADVDCYAIDLNGFGHSPPARDGDASLQGHARAVAEFVDERLDGAPVHLFGNSLGGAVALQVAGRRPDLARSLTLLSPALPGSRVTASNANLGLIAMPGVGERLLGRYRLVDAERRVLGTMRLCYGEADRLVPQRVEEAVADLVARDHLTYAGDEFARSLRGLLRSFAERGPDRPWKLAEHVACPTLVVYGGRDPLVDSRAARLAGRHFRNAELLILADGGHVPQMEHPDLVYEAWRSACLRVGQPA